MEPAKKKRGESEAVEQKIAMSIVQVMWSCYAFNASPEQAAKQVLTDLYEHLSGGGKVSVYVEALDGTVYELAETARR